MDRNFRKLVGAAALATLVAACKGDPTATLAGTAPSTISSSVSFLEMNIGDSVQVTAVVRDQAGDPQPAVPTATMGDATVASAATPVSGTPLVNSSVYVKALAPGATTLVLASGAATDTVKVIVFPSVFDGTVTTVTTAQLDTVVIKASAQLTFDTTQTTVTLNGVHTHVVSLTPTQLTVLSLAKTASAKDTVQLSNVVFLGSFPIASLNASTKVNTRGDATEPNDDPGTATALTLTGTSNTIVDGVFDGTTDVNDFYKVTLASSTTLTVEIDFDGKGSDPDLDVYVLDAAGDLNACSDDFLNCGAATTSQPQSGTTGTLPAGTYLVYVNFSAAGAATAPYWYRLKVKKNS